jgi:hypothetical protein
MPQRVVIALAVLAALALLFLLPVLIGSGSGGASDVPPVQLLPEPTAPGGAR